MESDTVLIGTTKIPRHLVSPATDSAPLLGQWGLLADRLAAEGYVAFSNFWDPHTVDAAREEVRGVLAASGRTNSFECNLHTGRCRPADDQTEAWVRVGASLHSLLAGDAKLQALLHALLVRLALVVPEHIAFQLAWARGKATDDGSHIHVDYYHVEPKRSASVSRGLVAPRSGAQDDDDDDDDQDYSDPDILLETDTKSWNVWTSLLQSSTASSYLAVAPGSHLLAIDPQRVGRSYPLGFEKLLRNHQARWHVLDPASGLAGPRTLVIQSMRIVHGATPNTGTEMRLSWDARFRVRKMPPREVVFGLPPAPHWGSCQRWTRRCHLDHPEEIQRVAMTLFLVNNRLKREGHPWLLSDLVALVMNHYILCTVPLWLPRSPPNLRRYRRQRTGIVFPNARFAHGLENEGTGTDEDSDPNPRYPGHLEEEYTGESFE